MRASLQITTGGSAGKRIELREGQAAQFGRTDWADFSFREDAGMADVHFLVACRSDGCWLQHLASDNKTLVNGKKFTQGLLHTGDRVTAGNTIFLMTVDGEPPLGDMEEVAAQAAAAAKMAEPPPPDLKAVCTELELDAALPHVKEGQLPAELIQILSGAKEFAVAARLQAHFFPKRTAVWWGCLCVQQVYGDSLLGPQKKAWEAARDWVASQNEDSRRAAEVAAEAASFTGSGGMIACAAFWSGDSLAPRGMPTLVPPDPKLTGVGVHCALLMASVYQDSRLAPARWQQFLGLAQNLTGEKINWPVAGKP